MDYPPLIHYTTIDEYKAHFERVYCKGRILTFDGIPVQFRVTNFEHCFFESSRRDEVKDAFSTLRSERMDWIKCTLQDPTSDRRIGWDKGSKSYVKSRRVALVQGDYVVIVRLRKTKSGRIVGNFVTAFVADTPSTLAGIKRSPKWTGL